MTPTGASDHPPAVEFPQAVAERDPPGRGNASKPLPAAATRGTPRFVHGPVALLIFRRSLAIEGVPRSDRDLHTLRRSTGRNPIRRRWAMATALVSVSVSMAGWAPADGLGAQEPTDAWFPRDGYFSVPAAAPREPRFSAGVVSTDLLAHPRVVHGSETPPPVSGDETSTQITVAIGGNLRLWRARTWDGGGAILGLQTGVFGRFDLEGSANALIASDWLVGVPLELRRDQWSARVRFVHWSAHLGDEFVRDSDARRLDFTFEAIDVLVAHDFDAVRIYGGGARVLRSQLADAGERPAGFSDDAWLQLGGDAGWYPWAKGSVGFSAGIDLQWADRNEWRGQVSGLAAFEARGQGRSLRIGLTWLDGPSHLGQFFLNEESPWGVEIRIDL